MGLFDAIVGAINSPDQQASPDQLGSILGAVQQLSGSRNLDANTTQAMISLVGGFVRSALQEKSQAGGEAQAQAIVNQFGGTQPSPAAVQSLFSPQQQQQVAQATSQGTGLNLETVQTLLPVVVPIILNLLKTGAPTQSAQGSNPVLHSFLDTNGDGSFDVGDALNLAGRFMQR